MGSHHMYTLHLFNSQSSHLHLDYYCHHIHHLHQLFHLDNIKYKQKEKLSLLLYKTNQILSLNCIQLYIRLLRKHHHSPLNQPQVHLHRLVHIKILFEDSRNLCLSNNLYNHHHQVSSHQYILLKEREEYCQNNQDNKDLQ